MTAYILFGLCVFVTLLMGIGTAGLIWIVLDIYESFFRKKPIQKQAKEFMSMDTMNLTSQIQVAINDMIMFRVAKMLLPYSSTEKRYDLRTIDKDVQKIAEEVFKGINPMVYSTNLFFTKEYLMEYIVNATSSYLIKTVTEFNKNM